MKITELRLLMRVRTIAVIDRSPDYTVPVNMLGTITTLGENEVWVNFDEHIEGAEFFYNHAYWSDDLGRTDGTEDRSDVLRKRMYEFFRDVEVMENANG